jgi:hypothetical protein
VVGRLTVPTAPKGPASAPFCAQVKPVAFSLKVFSPVSVATTQLPFMVASPTTPDIFTVEPTCCVNPSVRIK